MKTQKLLLVIGSLQGGGAERVISNMANYWAERGLEITLMTFDNPGVADHYFLHPSINRTWSYYLPATHYLSRLYFHLQRVLAVRNFIKKNKPDAVLSFITTTNVLTILAALRTSVHCVVSERIDPSKHNPGVLWYFGRKFLYRYAGLVVAQTEHVRRWLVNNTKAKVRIIPNFIGCEIKTKQSGGDHIIIAVGRLDYQKGFDILIKAFALISKTYPDWRLIIIGDGVERAALEVLASVLGITSQVQFVGHVQNPQDWLVMASIVVQPSRYEGFPNALLEAMADGIAAIASFPAGEMLITDEINGLLVPAENIEQLAFALQRLIENPELRSFLGTEATKVKMRFSKAKIMALWDAALLINHPEPYKIINGS